MARGYREARQQRQPPSEVLLALKRGKQPRITPLNAHQQWLRRQLWRYVTLYQPSTA